MAQNAPILVTGAGGGVGGMVVRFLREQGRPVMVGVFFGAYPANRAAKLTPIEALRYE